MNLGNTIRKARRAQELTQERLAEYLNVSVSAVSQWELNKTAPDLSFIPPLCHLLGISADTLLGIEEASSAAEIARLTERAEAFLKRGYSAQAREIAKEGLGRFPDSIALMKLLMYSYSWEQYCGDEEARHETRLNCIKVCQRLLSMPLEPDDRSGVLQSMIFCVNEEGREEEARSLAMKLPSGVVCRESLLCHIGSGPERLSARQSYLTTELHDVCHSLIYLNEQGPDGRMLYTEDEMAALRRKALAIYELMYEEGDYGFVHCRFTSIYDLQACYHLGKGDVEQALACLTLAADHAIAFVKWVQAGEGLTHTSLAFRGLKNAGFSTTGSENEARHLLNRMAMPIYDRLRGSEEFARIASRLQSFAGDWEVPGEAEREASV